LGAFVGSPGCGNSEKLYSVSGKVTLGDTPLTVGVVTLVREGSSKAGANPVGTIESNGTYTVSTNKSRGAPAGKYKVAISTMVPPGGQVTPGEKPPTGTPINLKYNNPETSPLSIEVVPNPALGQYDLKLK
jgi:hypothetical protein